MRSSSYLKTGGLLTNQKKKARERQKEKIYKERSVDRKMRSHFFVEQINRFSNKRHKLVGCEGWVWYAPHRPHYLGW